MPTAIYVRISADREGRELGVERQEADCRGVATTLGIAAVEVFSDNDISASRRSKKPRPGYQRMLDGVRAGRITTVIAYSTSRLTRRPREIEDLIELVEHHELSIQTVVSGHIDLSTAAGRTIAGILAAIDAGEADTMSERNRRERQQRREQGRWHGGFRPFGFDADGVTPRPAEQDLIRSGCAAVLAGRSIAGIARDWSEVMPPPTWRPPLVVRWSSTTVRDVLVNPRVAGMLPNGTTARDWAPIVDEVTWRGVVAILAAPARSNGRGDIRLLTGIARCGVEGCGGTLNAGQTKTGTLTYRCLVGRHLDRAAEPVDGYVRDVLVRYLATQKLPTAQSGPDLKHLAGRANGIRARLAELEESAADPDGPSPRMLAAAERKLDAELLEVEAEMAAAAGTSALVGLPTDEGELRAIWDAADTERRRALIQACPVRITVAPPGRGVREFNPETVQIVGR